MYAKVLLSAMVAATAMASPLPQNTNNPDPSWQPADDSAVMCTTDDKIISFVVGPQLDSVLNAACADMMPPCAYPDELPEGTVCPQTIDWPLDGPKNSTQAANVEDAENGDKLSGWAVKFTVTPAEKAEGSIPATWRKADCYGYIAYIVNEMEPQGCKNGMGSGIGYVDVGGSDSLKDTVFEVEIVERE